MTSYRFARVLAIPIVGLWLVVVTYAGINTVKMMGYESTTGTVTDSSTNNFAGHPRFTVPSLQTVSARYVAAGQSYVATSTHIEPIYSRYAPGTTIQVYYQASRPNNAVVGSLMDFWRPVLVIVASAVFVAVVGGLLWWLVYRQSLEYAIKKSFEHKSN